MYKILTADCCLALQTLPQTVDMTFLDPPFNQQKDYALHNDDMSEDDYWTMMKNVCQAVFNVTKKGRLHLFYAAGKKYGVRVENVA